MPKQKDCYKWTKWFAWYPVTIDGYRYWLCTVERRARWVDDWDMGWWAWEYRASS